MFQYDAKMSLLIRFNVSPMSFAIPQTPNHLHTSIHLSSPSNREEQEKKQKLALA